MCQGSGVSIKAAAQHTDKATRPVKPVKRWTIPYYRGSLYKNVVNTKLDSTSNKA